MPLPYPPDGRFSLSVSTEKRPKPPVHGLTFRAVLKVARCACGAQKRDTSLRAWCAIEVLEMAQNTRCKDTPKENRRLA